MYSIKIPNISHRVITSKLRPSELLTFFRTFGRQTAVKKTVVKPKKQVFKKMALGVMVAVPTGGIGTYVWMSDINKRKTRVTFEGLVRFLRTFYNGLFIGLDYKINLYGLDDSTTEEYKIKFKEINERTADRILRVCLTNGGLYIKFGQVLGTINHILPKEILTKLAVLQDRALERKNKEIDNLFLEDFGSTPDKLFREFEPEPIAAASLAQVHIAVTHQGDEVAVKIQYINLRDQYSGDLKTMEILLDVVHWLFPEHYNFKEILKETRGPLSRELDFENEGRNAERCARGLKHLPYVYVPKIYWKTSSKRVLTMEYIHALKVTDVDGIKEMGLSFADVADKLIKIFAEQIFHTGFVHADPHPGNVFVRQNNRGKAELVLLDHGLYEELSPKIRVAFCNYWTSIIMKDVEGMKRYAADLGVREYKLFAMMIMQRPLNLQAKRGLHMTFMMTPDQFRKLGAEFQQMGAKREDFIERGNQLLHSLPKSLYLVFRNMNTVRGIHRTLGMPANYITLMARCAIGGTAQDAELRGFKDNMRARWDRFLFDFTLASDRFLHWLQTFIMQWMLRLGLFQKIMTSLKDSDKPMEPNKQMSGLAESFMPV
ncbi:uncharacterized aarF domain-containing protein kinase 5-like isoform X2 [Anneissia japonica]|nr:uncharacterized aarF domain-containing protein kinase 5-like isoform X2 [Anneissia japonica]XP_033117184.1 uncharacterized aarF domain-containing protein kinase 5-like isoform X2 [Anneissia japonica]XP_033117185.1 uncharacterized aarF domain-containing protein kinase 5-like isoform X2 [Anneissia japonica]XP_033117186.1 uncharacterized aarF domain-containing protein kinase 5-like isoform X2 [Anneissia japonica]